MKFNTITKILCVVGIVASPLSLAKQTDAGISFTTVPDVSIIQLQALAYGSDMTLGLNDTCILAVNSTDAPSEADAGISNSGAGSSGSYLTRSGGCGGAAGTVTAGIYEVSGGAGVPVKITLNTLTGTNFNFAPTGTVGTYGTPDSDTFVNLVADGEATATLASVASVTGAVSGGTPQAGKTKVFVGGTLTASTALSAGTTYTETFTIDVTY